MSKQKQSENVGKETQKKNVEEKWIKKKPRGKNGLRWKWREIRKKDQSRIGPSCDGKWSLV